VIGASGGAEPDSGAYLYDPSYLPWEGQGYRYLRPVTRRECYTADITYGIYTAFGFDYLRDNMAFTAEQRTEREPFCAIVDEADTILIDGARTPLIITGPSEGSTDLYTQIDRIIPRLTRQAPITNDEGKPAFGEGDFSVDEKARQVALSEDGHQHVQEMLTEMGLLAEGESLYDATNVALMHHVSAALRAHALFHRNVEYIVRDGQIIIVNKVTGHTEPGNRWSEGLHQAIEAKEGVPIQPETRPLASISVRSYARLYPKLSGMTATAETAAEEFRHDYGLDVVAIPHNQPMIRQDAGDLVYLTAREKYAAVVDDVRDCLKRGQPVLIGTTSAEGVALVSSELDAAGIPHHVLNASHEDHEAELLGQAGLPGAVTVATETAGRGIDILLGGNLEAELEQAGPGANQEAIRAVWKLRQAQVIAAGGLHVIGTERHESRRFDQQLRNRAGRQGDPGSSRFYLSLEDSLMRIFASERVSGMMQKLGMQPGEAIEHPWITKAIENAQRKLEQRNLGIRKQQLAYDDVADDQRKVVYRQRREIVDADSVGEAVDAMRDEVLNKLIDADIPRKSREGQWQIPGLSRALTDTFGGDWPIQRWLDQDHSLHAETLGQRIHDLVAARYAEREQAVGSDVMRHVEKAVMLQTLDTQWKDHLAAMDYLRQGIHLRGYGQKDPTQEYRREAFEMFSTMLDSIKQEVVDTLARLRVQTPEEAAALNPEPEFQFKHEEFHDLDTAPEPEPEPASKGELLAHRNQPTDSHHEPFLREQRTVGRNEPCPCGSGKKYKQCHGKAA